VVVFLPVRAARAASVGSGASPVRGGPPVIRSAGVLKSASVTSKSVRNAPAPAAKSSKTSVEREPRGGTPSKKKR